ncbi:MAG: FAD-binding protein, partial [Candidatus Eremiobacteraeota bacterium]|nr:FAD-binding protein [Candidatus Eremiobacteraeota bacterium]
MSRASVADATKRVVPAGIADVQRIVAEANARATPVAIEGGNTLTGMGLPGTAAFVLSTAALKRVKSYSAADLTVSVESGMTVRTLRTLLAETRQFVPIDAPRAQHATVGGTLAANWLSPRRHLYGRARDFVIGSQIVLADGTLAHAGGMVVKNVAGYDMSRLYVGSFGTLGILTSLNFKTL